MKAIDLQLIYKVDFNPEELIVENDYKPTLAESFVNLIDRIFKALESLFEGNKTLEMRSIGDLTTPSVNVSQLTHFLGDHNELYGRHFNELEVALRNLNVLKQAVRDVEGNKNWKNKNIQAIEQCETAIREMRSNKAQLILERFKELTNTYKKMRDLKTNITYPNFAVQSVTDLVHSQPNLKRADVTKAANRVILRKLEVEFSREYLDQALNGPMGIEREKFENGTIALSDELYQKLREYLVQIHNKGAIASACPNRNFINETLRRIYGSSTTHDGRDHLGPYRKGSKSLPAELYNQLKKVYKEVENDWLKRRTLKPLIN